MPPLLDLSDLEEYRLDLLHPPRTEPDASGALPGDWCGEADLAMEDGLARKAGGRPRKPAGLAAALARALRSCRQSLSGGAAPLPQAGYGGL